jgi:hypothetical protein
MLGWARETAHRLMGSYKASLETRGPAGETLGGDWNNQASPRSRTPAFDRFLREFRTRNAEVFREHPPGPRTA